MLGAVLAAESVEEVLRRVARGGESRATVFGEDRLAVYYDFLDEGFEEGEGRGEDDCLVR